MGKPTLFIAAGHGADDPGNTGGPVPEAELTIRTVDGIVAFWKRCGFLEGYGGWLMIPHEYALEKQIEAVNQHKPDLGDLALDIHFDWRGRAGGSGAMAIADQTTIAQRFCQGWLLDWTRFSSITNRGVVDSIQWATKQRGWPDMGWCKPRFPGAILEIASLNDANDMKKVQNLSFVEGLATTIWLNWQYVRGFYATPKS